jgi:hypothetical protein
VSVDLDDAPDADVAGPQRAVMVKPRALAALEAPGLVRREGNRLVVLAPARLANGADV